MCFVSTLFIITIITVLLSLHLLISSLLQLTQAIQPIAMAYAYLFKYIIIGDTGVGKSCLLLQVNQSYVSGLIIRYTIHYFEKQIWVSD